MAEAEVEVKDVPTETEPEAPKTEEAEVVEAPAEPPQEEQTMRAVVLTGHGGYGKLKVEKRPKPKATEGHVVVKVHACGQNFADLMQRQGMLPHLPKSQASILGLECSGVVEEVGEHVTGLEVGSRVCCNCIPFTGAFAEFAAVPATYCYAMPDSMSFEDGAALPVSYLTAYFLLFHCGNVTRRRNVLIHSASGGVGMALTQLCKTVEGVTVFGTASASKHEVITKNGVDHAIDYRTEDYVEAIKKITGSLDLVLDPLGGADTKKCYDLLGPLGALVTYGYANNIAESKGLFAGLKSWYAGLTFNPLKLIQDSKTVCGIALQNVNPELLKEAMDVLMKMYENGAIKPHIDTVFALEEVAKAHQKMHDHANIGKILLSPLKEPDPAAEPVKKRKRSASKFHTEKPKNEKGDKSSDDEKPKNDSQEGAEKQPEAAKQEEKESTEDAPAEKKEEGKEEAKEEPKQEAKVEAKEEAKEEPKEEAKEEAKEDAKEETKEEPKQEVKEEAKEEVKEEAKEEAKEETKEETKDEPKQEVKEEAKEEVKEEQKDQAPEEPKEETKEENKEEAKEEMQEEQKQEVKEEAQEEQKEEPKEEPKQDQMEETTEDSKGDQQTTEAEQQQPETKEANGEQNTEM